MELIQDEIELVCVALQPGSDIGLLARTERPLISKPRVGSSQGLVLCESRLKSLELERARLH